jgi:hypothetical protein
MIIPAEISGNTASIDTIRVIRPNSYITTFTSTELVPVTLSNRYTVRAAG